MNKEKVKINKPWNLPVSTLYEKFSTSPSGGLSKKQVSSQKRIYGQNRLREVKSRSAWRVFVDQIANLIMLLLLTAAALSFYLHDWIEGFAIVAVMLLTALIGFFTEIRAVRAMESLREMSRVNTVVIRDSETRKIPAMEIVPGDILLFEGGDIVTADVRLFEANKLQADESALTGESVPVKKNVTELDEDTPLAERTNMLFKGTAVTSGSAKGIVTATGMDTELGNISDLVASAEQEVTPLEKRLDRLGRKLIWLTLGIAAAVAGLGIIHGKALYMMIETSIALAVAAIPEGLPIVATVALARGMI
ncbi:MAG: HAD-IC family P-type ATPase, partial [Calditrichaceae bacterium]